MKSGSKGGAEGVQGGGKPHPPTVVSRSNTSLGGGGAQVQQGGWGGGERGHPLSPGPVVPAPPAGMCLIPLQALRPRGLFGIFPRNR